jgi:Cu-Zn family superoxide dismutase
MAFAAAPIQAQSAANGASAELKDGTGQVVGSAALVSNGAGGVKLQVTVRNFASAASGEHGIHIHAVGVCEAPQFTTAGGHFNPNGKKHGLNSSEGAHAGDLPNLMLGADGSATYEANVAALSLDGGAANSIFDADGSAVVIHAGPDDLVTDPAGNSGARIACGVLNAAVLPVGMPGTGSGSANIYLWLAVGAMLLILGATTLRRKKSAA